MSKEKWKRIPRWHYEVSDGGMVRNCRTGRTLKPHASGNYLAVSLCRNGRVTRLRVNRLVCTIFHGRGRGRDAAHQNGDPHDNRASNLRWMTRSANLLMRHQHGHAAPWNAGEHNGRAKLTLRDVTRIRVLYATGAHTQPELAKRFGVCSGTIRRITRNIGWRV